MKCLECNAELSYLRSDHFTNKCSGVVKTLGEYKAKYPGAETMDLGIRLSRAQTLENMIRRHGESLGQEKWEVYCSKHSKKISAQAFIEKGKTAEDFAAYNASRAQTLKNMIRRHGESIGREKWEAYCSKQRKNGNTLEYFVEKYGDLGAQIYADVNGKKAITLENMCRVHGDDEGILRWNLWHQRSQGNYISKNASRFVKALWEIFPDTYIVHDGIFSKEFCVYDERPYFYDLVITSPFKAVIEYNGDFWHANPSKYKPDQIVPLRGSPKLASEIWKRDEDKLHAIQKRGFDVLVIWDSEFLNNPDDTIKKVQQWLLSKNESLQ